MMRAWTPPIGTPLTWRLIDKKWRRLSGTGILPVRVLMGGMPMPRAKRSWQRTGWRDDRRYGTVTVRCRKICVFKPMGTLKVCCGSVPLSEIGVQAPLSVVFHSAP